MKEPKILKIQGIDKKKENYPKQVLKDRDEMNKHEEDKNETCQQ